MSNDTQVTEADRALAEKIDAALSSGDGFDEAEQLIASYRASQTKALEIQLGAWHALFGTTQLTHAIAARDTAEKQLATLRAKADKLKLAVNELYCAGRWDCNILTLDKQIALWEAVRDAAEIAVGTATSKGVQA